MSFAIMQNVRSDGVNQKFKADSNYISDRNFTE